MNSIYSMRHIVGKPLMRTATILACLVCAGCASNMKVSVEMISPVGGLDTVHDDNEKAEKEAGWINVPDTDKAAKDKAEAARRADIVHETLVSLDKYRSAFDALRDRVGRDKMNAFITAYDETFDESTNNAKAWVIKKHIEGEQLIKQSATSTNFDVMSYVDEVAGRFANDKLKWHRELDKAVSAALKDKGNQSKEKQKSFKDVATDVHEQIDVILDGRLAQSHAAQITARNSLNPSSQFGGFKNVGVHQISPGDPYYSSVLNGTTVGEPITEVVAHASGDSTVIFVQEQPTEFRVYSIDMDATKIIQNVKFVGEKLMEAWAKYMTAGAAPTGATP